MFHRNGKPVPFFVSLHILSKSPLLPARLSQGPGLKEPLCQTTVEDFSGKILSVFEIERKVTKCLVWLYLSQLSPPFMVFEHFYNSISC